MAPSFEFEARNVEKAVKKAGEQLNIEPGELKYEIISYGSSGIFGLVGVKKAKIRVKHQPVAEKIKAVPAETEIPIVEIGDAAPERPGETEAEAEAEKDDLIPVAEEGKVALERIVGAISPESIVDIEMEKETIGYQVSGGDSSQLIGKRGQTLEAIQYLLEKIVNKDLEKRVRIQVDIEGYLKNKKKNLIKLAEKLASKAKKTGKPVTMGQMNAYDRRIVHLSLKNNNGVRTQSRGDGFYRKLIIFPRRKPKEKN